jgi:precorrin-6A synthase
VRTVLVIGIGAGDPEQVTVQAIRAMNRADAVFVIEKDDRTEELVRLRREILERYLEDGRRPRVVSLPDPSRDRSAAAYPSSVEDWRRRRADQWEQAIAAEDGCCAFLVWGDPAIYDSTLAVLDDVLARGNVVFDHQVIPGISSVQALAARHRVPFNRVGGAVQITTGRRLAAGFPTDADDVLVMLDADCAFTELDGDVDIYWGAYIGTADEILIAGRVADVAEEIRRVRREARERKGWVMDCYLLRRRRG